MAEAGARAQALAYLASHHVMTLATSGPEGPWAAGVFYANDGFTLYFLSSPASRHARTVGDGGEVAAAVHEDYADWTAIQGVQMEGRARRLDGDERDSARTLYARKFPFAGGEAPEPLRAALDRIAWYALVPRRVLFVDNTVAFGHREEVGP